MTIKIVKRSGSRWEEETSLISYEFTDSIEISNKRITFSATSKYEISEIILIYKNTKYMGPFIITSLNYENGIYTYEAQFFFYKELDQQIIWGELFPATSNTVSQKVNSLLSLYFYNIQIPDFCGISLFDSNKSFNYRRNSDNSITLIPKGTWSLNTSTGEVITSADYEAAVLFSYPLGYTFNKSFTLYVDITPNPEPQTIDYNQSVLYEFSYDDGNTWKLANYANKSFYTVIPATDTPQRIYFRIISRNPQTTLTLTIDQTNPQFNIIPGTTMKYIGIRGISNAANIITPIIQNPNSNISTGTISKGSKTLYNGIMEFCKSITSQNAPGSYAFYVDSRGIGYFGDYAFFSSNGIFEDKSNTITLIEGNDFIVDNYREIADDSITQFVKLSSITDTNNNTTYTPYRIHSPEHIYKSGGYKELSNEEANNVMSVYNKEITDVSGLTATVFSDNAKQVNIGDMVSIKLNSINTKKIMQLSTITESNNNVTFQFGQDLRYLYTAWSLLKFDRRI